MPYMVSDEKSGQLGFGFKTARKKRKPRRGRPRKMDAGVSHQRRQVHPRYPLHVTLKVERHVWQLRSQRCFRIVERAFYFAARIVDARIAHFSVQGDHVHLIVEARDGIVLARSIQGFAIRVAKGLNKLMNKKGSVFVDRFHARPLRTPTEVRRAIVYVLGNAKKHAREDYCPNPHFAARTQLDAKWIDPFSSAPFFDGWVDAGPVAAGPASVQPAKTWLLSVGWRERGGGLIRREEAPVTT
jgi:putative transposase